MANFHRDLRSFRKRRAPTYPVGRAAPVRRAPIVRAAVVVRSVACAHPGKLGDVLYALPAIRALSARYGVPVDFHTSRYCTAIVRLFERQSAVARVIVSSHYVAQNFNCGAQPSHLHVAGNYDVVHQLGYPGIPSGPLPDYIAGLAGLPAAPAVSYEFDDAETLAEPYIVIAPRQPTTYIHLFEELIARCPIRVVEIGGASEATGSKLSVDRTGLDMLDTLPWLARSVGFVGLMSSMLVLANGFPIPKVAPHDGKRWDMRHVVRSPSNHYPVLPSAVEVLKLLGLS